MLINLAQKFLYLRKVKKITNFKNFYFLQFQKQNLYKPRLYLYIYILLNNKNNFLNYLTLNKTLHTHFYKNRTNFNSQ